MAIPFNSLKYKLEAELKLTAVERCNRISCQPGAEVGNCSCRIAHVHQLLTCQIVVVEKYC